MADGIVQIELTRGKVALIDEADAQTVGKHKWFADPSRSTPTYYAKTGNGNGGHQTMHRLIMGVTDPRVEVDHRDGDGLNNTRDNLRVVNHFQNMRNKRKHRAGASRFKGVSKRNDRVNKVWRSRIFVDGKSKLIGYYDTEEFAAVAYNNAATEHVGEFARLNELT
jgi:hypothetical protein